MEPDFTNLSWLSASVFEWAYRPHIQCTWEIHAGFSGDHRWRTLALSFQNPSIWLSGLCDSIFLVHTDHFISSCFPLLQSIQFLTVLPQFNACLLYHAGHVLTHLGLLFSYSFPSTPQECLLLPTHPYLIQTPRLSSILPFKIFWTLG